MLEGASVQQHTFATDAHVEPVPSDVTNDDEHTTSSKSHQTALPEKAIVFSQFLEHINVIQQQVILLQTSRC